MTETKLGVQETPLSLTSNGIGSDPVHDVIIDRVGCERDGELSVIDEIVATGVDIHIERMNDGLYWMSITKGGTRPMLPGARGVSDLRRPKPRQFVRLAAGKVICNTGIIHTMPRAVKPNNCAIFSHGQEGSNPPKCHHHPPIRRQAAVLMMHCIDRLPMLFRLEQLAGNIRAQP